MCVVCAREREREVAVEVLGATPANHKPCSKSGDWVSRDPAAKLTQQYSKGVRLMSCLVTMALRAYPDNTSYLPLATRTL